MFKVKFKLRFRKLLLALLAAFALLNAIVFLHAYRFTHFSYSAEPRTKSKLTTGEKIAAFFTGVKNPRPQNHQLPNQSYQTLKLQSNTTLDAWLLTTNRAKGTVILFHGYGAEKSSMLDKAYAFLNLRYNVLLVDFMGAGGSEGNQTTIGFKEAEEVNDCFAYLQSKGEDSIFLFGTSMGAVAIMKAIADYGLKPNSIMLECPFGTMYETVCARFKMVGLPVFPLAGMLVFWGGLQNGFWGFLHNPEDYAKKITCPTLLLYGEKDDRVSRTEIDRIFRNLSGPKMLATYPLAGHENYLRKYAVEWTEDVSRFLAH